MDQQQKMIRYVAASSAVAGYVISAGVDTDDWPMAIQFALEVVKEGLAEHERSEFTDSPPGGPSEEQAG